MWNYGLPSADLWVEGSKLKTAIVGTNSIVEVEGTPVEAPLWNKTERYGFLGICKREVQEKAPSGYIWHIQGDLCYVDQNGQGRRIDSSVIPVIQQYKNKNKFVL